MFGDDETAGSRPGADLTAHDERGHEGDDGTMRAKDAVVDRRMRTRLVLSAGILAGVLAAVFFVLVRPSPNITFDVFYAAAESGMRGRVVYETGTGLYVYTPVVLLFFYPFVWLFEFETAMLAFRLFTVLWVVGYAALVAWFLDDVAALDRIDRLLVFGFVAATVYPVTVVATANFGIVFGSLLGVGFVVLERDRDAGGGAWAAAALVKGFPAMWGVYLLRVRRWRAVAAAIVTGLGATLLGVLWFGLDAYVRFVSVAAADRVRIERFAGGASPDNEAVTPIRPLSQLFPTVDPHVWTPIIVVVVLAGTAAIYYLVTTETVADRATLLLATVVGITFAMPTSQDLDVYLVYVPVLVLLYVERDGPVQALYALGTLLLAYNVGRGELRTVAGIAGDGVAGAVMAVGEPVLGFATMPLYGLVCLYAGCLLKARHRGRERGRTAAVRRRLDPVDDDTGGE